MSAEIDHSQAHKTVIITGAASGIGLATVSRFAEDPKYNPIIAVDRDPEVHNIFKYTPNVTPVVVDVTDHERSRDLVRRVGDDLGHIDVLVNAAGVMIKGNRRTFWDKNKKPTPELGEMYKVNLQAPIVLMVAALAYMPKKGGTIVNISSAKYLFPDPHHGVYQEGKTSLSQTTRRLASDYRRDYNVRLIDLQPGNTKTRIDRGSWTPGNSQAEIESAQRITNWWRNTFGSDPKDVAQVIYDAAEEKINKKSVYVGLDTKIGRALYLLTYPAGIFRFGYVFGVLGICFYEGAKWLKVLEDKAKKIKSRLNNSGAEERT